MSNLSRLAIEFARECLGWDNPTAGGSAGPFVFPTGGWCDNENYLWYSHIDKVMEFVRRWCRGFNLSFTQHHILQTRFAFEFQQWLDGMADIEWLCGALLTACIEAQRKLTTRIEGE
jgi:hypothetical protein